MRKKNSLSGYFNPSTFAHSVSVKSLQSCLTLCNPIDCIPPDFSVHGILQARILSGLPCPPSGDLPDPGIEPTSLMSPALASRFFTTIAHYDKYTKYLG